MSHAVKLDHCPVCGRLFPKNSYAICAHPGIITSNIPDDWRAADGRLIFSYDGMVAQLEQLGYLVK